MRKLALGLLRARTRTEATVWAAVASAPSSSATLACIQGLDRPMPTKLHPHHPHNRSSGAMHDPPVDAALAEAVVQAVHAELPGLEAAIRPLVHAILAFAAEAEAAADAADEGGDGGMGRQPMRGLVIEGPSGVGKTSLARAGACSDWNRSMDSIASTPHPPTTTRQPSHNHNDSRTASRPPPPLRGGLGHLRAQPRRRGARRRARLPRSSNPITRTSEPPYPPLHPR